MVSQAKDRDAKATFIELARQWQERAQRSDRLASSLACRNHPIAAAAPVVDTYQLM